MTKTTADLCPVCLTLNPVELHQTGDRYRLRCGRCGRFEISDTAWMESDFLTDGGKLRPLLSIVVRQASDRGELLYLSTHSIPELIKTARPAENLLEAIDAVVLGIADQQRSFGDPAQFSVERDYPAFGFLDVHDFNFAVVKARELGYIDPKSRLDVKGWQRALELRTTRKLPNQAFAAMSFAPEMLSAWTEGIRPALHDTGFDPFRVDTKEHNEKIDDLIIAEIRRSGLVVADFTGHRGGVYFEAGFAMGLGIPLIRTCRSEDMEKLHFDIRQYNHVEWTTESELRKKLTLRIAATIPGRADKLPTAE